ncbi:putative calcineurin-like phosphoesterase [Xylariaceae sp. FL0804]|nr:putative calcineurin-like phosphoesterase [Xylariaceae sp. FL0804]
MKAFLQAIGRRLDRSPAARLQILSDLHLEVGQQYSTFTFPVSAPFLLLCGDIGRLIDYAGYLGFLEAQVARYEKVFLVLGNHEFYGLEYHSGIDKARQLSEEPSLADKFILLNRRRWDDPDSSLTVLGCTLWSAIPPDAYDIVRSKISDFKKIDGWTVEMHNQAHEAEIGWLRKQVAGVASLDDEVSKRDVLVVTHHAPCVEGTSRPSDSSNPWTSAFATELLGRGDWSGVKTWAFGHTHYSTNMVRDGVRVVANQRGYVLPGSAEHGAESRKGTKRGKHDFDPTMVIAV